MFALDSRHDYYTGCSSEFFSFTVFQDPKKLEGKREGRRRCSMRSSSESFQKFLPRYENQEVWIPAVDNLQENWREAQTGGREKTTWLKNFKDCYGESSLFVFRLKASTVWISIITHLRRAHEQERPQEWPKQNASSNPLKP